MIKYLIKDRFSWLDMVVLGIAGAIADYNLYYGFAFVVVGSALTAIVKIRHQKDK